MVPGRVLDFVDVEELVEEVLSPGLLGAGEAPPLIDEDREAFIDSFEQRLFAGIAAWRHGGNVIAAR